MSSKNQGEGNRDAARNYNKDTQDFIKSGGVEKNKSEHTKMSEAELKTARKAAELAKAQAKS